ncbi:thiosulfate oxidation carrier protein SoxY [Candidatus Venteria ishoeyi]|nr:thiosulfate oxidation carrier protein SoxY [Candidatus Venteria ishoeyi]
MKRRTFITNALVGGAAAAGAALLPRAAFSADWPKDAFEAKSVSDALSKLLGSSDQTESADITIKAPDIAENGAVVPVQVTATMPNVESISIIAEKNPVPLIASFQFGDNGAGFVSTRIKMGKTSNVIAVVKADGKLFSAKKEVKVTIGGCGG